MNQDGATLLHRLSNECIRLWEMDQKILIVHIIRLDDQTLVIDEVVLLQLHIENREDMGDSRALESAMLAECCNPVLRYQCHSCS